MASATQINTADRLEIGADDGSFTLRVRARLQFDGSFSQKDKKELASGFYVRRARIGIQGNLHEWGYKIMYDNAKPSNPLVDAKVFRNLGPGTIWIGQLKMMEGLEEMTRDSDTLFMERSYLGEIMPGHRAGLAYNGWAEKFGYQGSFYSRSDSGDNTQQPTNVGNGGILRGFFLPINRKGLVAHLGASEALEKTETNGAYERVNVIGRDDKYVDGSDFHFVIYDRQGEKAAVHRTVLEGLAINGPLMLEGEYLTGRVTTHTRPDDTFYSWYGEAGFLLTGDFHEYDAKKGRPERPKPMRAAGAVELVARYQRAARTSVDNALLSATEYGVTYYANRNVSFMVNYSIVDNKLTNDNPKLLAVRTQVDF